MIRYTFTTVNSRLIWYVKENYSHEQYKFASVVCKLPYVDQARYEKEVTKQLNKLADSLGSGL